MNVVKFFKTWQHLWFYDESFPDAVEILPASQVQPGQLLLLILFADV